MSSITPAGQLALALAVFAAMITTGMAINTDDFRRLLRRPRAVLVGLGSQLVLLPAAGFLLAWLLPISGTADLHGTEVAVGPLFAVGIVLLASTPGGSGSNFLIHAVGGDRALSVTLTALSSTIAFVTLPIYMALAFRLFLNQPGETVTLPVSQMVLSVALLTVVPVSIGMFIRHHKRALADRLEVPSKILAGLVIGAIIIGVIIGSWDVIVAYWLRLGPVMLALNLLALALGFAAAKLTGLSHREGVAISVETGVQNAPLAITLALTVLAQPAFSTPAGLFGISMLITAAILAFVTRRRARAEEQATIVLGDMTQPATPPPAGATG